MVILKKRLLKSAPKRKDEPWNLVNRSNPKPVPSRRAGGVIPVCEPVLLGNEKKYVNDCLDTNWISSKGKYIEKFEQGFAEYCGVGHAVSCTSGTTALHLLLHALGIGPKDEVIVPTFSIIATANAVALTGATVVFADCEPEHFTIDPDKIEELITENSRAILPTHIYGHPCRMKDISKIGDLHDLWIVEDAAEAFGAHCGLKKAGALGDGAAFSLYANKMITTGEGGMITTDNPDLASLLRTLRDQAFIPEIHFWHYYTGFNYRMPNLQAAIGLAQLEKAEELIERRIRNAEYYSEGLRTIPGLVLPHTDSDTRNVHWMFALTVSKQFSCTRDELMIELALRGIETKTFFIPLHLQPIYYQPKYDGKFPVSEKIAREGLYLPSSGNLKRGQIDYIVESIRDVSRNACQRL